MDRGSRSLATAIHRGDAKWRRVMQLRPPLCVVKEVAAVGGKMLFADRGTQQVRPHFAAQVHTLPPVPVLVVQRVGNVRLEGHFLGKEMAGVASAGRAVRQRELSAEASAVSVAMAGDVDAVAAIDRKQARCRDTRVVADALAPNKGGHQLLPGQHPPVWCHDQRYVYGSPEAACGTRTLTSRTCTTAVRYAPPDFFQLPCASGTRIADLYVSVQVNSLGRAERRGAFHLDGPVLGLGRGQG